MQIRVSAARKQQRLEAALAGREASLAAELGEAVADAQLLGSLQLAGVVCDWDAVLASRRAPSQVPEIEGLRRARQAVPAGAALDTGALLAWHSALGTGAAGLRRGTRDREGGPPPAPPDLVAGRLELLWTWLEADSGRALGPAQAGALVLARLVEILPFHDANGRVARLAASHLIVRAGGRPPILVAGDRLRLEQALQAAFRLETEPLVALLDEACERPLDVMLQVLAGRG